MRNVKRVAAMWCCALLVTACVSSAPALPSEGERDWARIDGPRFVMFTNQDIADAYVSYEQLELFYKVFMQFGWADPVEPRRPITVVLLKNREELATFLPSENGGVFLPAAWFSPVIVGVGLGDRQGLRVIKHELVHYLVSLSTPHQPAWFSEGFACYFETADVGLRNHIATIGVPSPEMVYALNNRDLMPARDLLSPGARAHDYDFYMSAWFLVHYLMGKRPTDLLAYHQRLVRGEDGVVAWNATFPDLTHEHLDSELQAYLQGEPLPPTTNTVDDRMTQLPQRALMSDADVLALRAWLYAFNLRGDDDRAAMDRLARVDLAALGRLEPLHPWGTIVELMMLTNDARQAATLARKLAHAHPEVPYVWMTLLLKLQAAHVDAHVIDRAAAAAVRRHPHDVDLLLLAADSAFAAKAYDAGLARARAAFDLRPRDGDVLLVYARALILVGECDEGARIADEALPRLALRDTRKRQLVDDLRKLALECQGGRDALPPPSVGSEP